MNDYNRNVDAGDRKFIYEGCIGMNASIKRAEIVKEMVGLRPGRNQVRLERDTYTTSEYCTVMMINRLFLGAGVANLLFGLWIAITTFLMLFSLIWHSRTWEAATNYS